MEPLTMFASTVGLIGALHLLFSAEERFSKGKYNRGNQQAKREDWYCFFDPKDLIGTVNNKKQQQPPLTDTERLEQRRRQQANRPRLQA